MAVSGISALAEDDYFPLALGQEKTMVVHYTDGGPETFVCSRVEGTVQRGGKTYFVVRKYYNAYRGKGSTALIRKDKKGTYTLSNSQENAVEEIGFRPPMTSGATRVRDVAGPRTYTNMGLEALGIAGITYKNCHHIRATMEDAKFSDDYWYAPNVGLIKEIVVFPNGRRMTAVLKNFFAGASGAKVD